MSLSVDERVKTWEYSSMISIGLPTVNLLYNLFYFIFRLSAMLCLRIVNFVIKVFAVECTSWTILQENSMRSELDIYMIIIQCTLLYFMYVNCKFIG